MAKNYKMLILALEVIVKLYIHFIYCAIFTFFAYSCIKCVLVLYLF